MTAANDSVWLYASITLKNKTDYTTSTYYALNRPDGRLNYDITCAPILKAVRGIGVRMGNVLPQTQTGTVTLDDAPNTIGFQRRFSDLLERNTIVDQTLEIYSSICARDTATKPTYTLDYRGVVSGFVINRESNELSISVVPTPLSVADRTMMIDSVTFPSAPIDSLGKYVPLVLGAAAWVRPLRVTADNTWPMDLAWGTGFGSQFVADNTIITWAKDYRGIWKWVVSATDVDAAVYTDGGSSSGTQPLVNERAYNFWVKAVSYGRIVYGVSTEIVESASARAGQIKICIYESDVNGTTPIDPPIASAIFDKADLPTGTGAYELKMRFDKCVVIASGTCYYIGISESNPAPTDAVTFSSSTVSDDVYDRDPDTGSWSWAADYHIRWNIFCCEWEDGSTAANAGGFTARYWRLLAPTAASNQTDPDPTDLEIVLSVNGVQDDGDGTITGTPNAYVQTTPNICELLDYTFNGTSWVEQGGFDSSLYATSHADFLASTSRNYRDISGVFEGRTLAVDAIGEVCKQSACRVGKRMNAAGTKSWGVYAWGRNLANQAVLTDENSKILTVTQKGVESIVNTLELRYDYRPIDLGTNVNVVDGRATNYGGTIKWDYTTNTDSAALSTESFNIYGNRANRVSEYDLIRLSKSAETISRYLLATNAHPHVFVELSCPFFNFNTLELFDIIEILHPDLPAYFGTATNAKPAHYEGDEADVLKGFYLKRAQRYRAQIEAKQIDYEAESTPQLILTCRLLLNYPADPT